jgi:hypothetical protein
MPSSPSLQAWRNTTSPGSAMCTFGQHEDRTPTHSYAATREATMAAFAKSWRRRRE